MHELSIALSILDVASEEAEQRGVQVVAVRLKLGPLSGVVTQALLSAWELARQESPLPAARLVIEQTSLIIRCPVCDADRPAVSIQQLCCRLCGAAASDVISGRELEVTAMEVIDAPANPTGRSTPESAQAE